MRRELKPGNMLYPLPAVLVSCGDGKGTENLLTVAWVGTVCSDPPMVSVSVRKERFSHRLIEESGEFVVNLVSARITRAADYCGVRSGRDGDKWKASGLTPVKAPGLGKAPAVLESPVWIACRVDRVLELGSHDMFLAKVAGVYADEALFEENGRLDLSKADLMAYSHGEYFRLGEKIGSFGWSVKKK